MNITEQSIIGKLVAENYRYASVFKSAGIDFCCNGNRTIGEACSQKKIAPDPLLHELQKVPQSASQEAIDFQSWPLDLLADYIEKRHHRYVEHKTQEIKPFLSKVVKVHGGHHPELAEVEQLFDGSVSELAAHMKKEELMLFPSIRRMIKATNDGAEFTPAPFGTVQSPISVMLNEHEAEGDRFRRISELTDNYTPPPDACNTYRVTFALLKEFEDDLHMHIHLENNILFPKAIGLEKSLTTA